MPAIGRGISRRAFLSGASLLTLSFGVSAVSGCHTIDAHRRDAKPGNFGVVNAALFRGAQPNGAELEVLRNLGVRTVVNLRTTPDTWTEEAGRVRALGMNYVAVPMRGLVAPTDAQVARVLELIETAKAPVFLHCEHGADRTGTVVACYRITSDGWPTGRALSEAESYGLSMFQLGMRRYIRNYVPTADR